SRGEGCRAGEHAVPVGERGKPEAAEGDPLHRLVGGVEHDLVDATPALIEGPQGGRVLVGLGAKLVQLAARHLAHSDEMWTGAFEGGRVHHELAEELEVLILEVEVEATRGRHRVLRGHRRETGQTHRTDPTGSGVPSMPSQGNPRWASTVGAMFT